MKTLRLIPLCLLFAISAFAQKGEFFPEMQGESLTNQQVTVPNDTKDKLTLVGLAYSKKAEDDLKTWFQPVYDNFLKDAPKNSFIPVMRPDVHVYFIPMFTGLKKAASGAALRKMKKDIDPKLHPNILVYSGNMKEYKDPLGLEKKDEPYFFVLDKTGKIVYATEGRCTPHKINAVLKFVKDWE